MPQPSGCTRRPVVVGVAVVERRPVVCTVVGDVRRPVVCRSPVVRRPLELIVLGAVLRPPEPAAGDARRVNCPLLGEVRRSDVLPAV
jgi:hypothetical protein